MEFCQKLIMSVFEGRLSGVEVKRNFVAYIDILGFSDYVTTNTDNANNVLDFLKSFTGAAQDFNILHCQISAFSDNIIISSITEDELSDFNFEVELAKFILYINTFQLQNTVFKGILPMRGGVSYGNLYHEKSSPDGSSIVFGTALLEAHEIEMSNAIYPRIVVKPKLESFLNPEKMIESNKSLSWLSNSLGIPQKDYTQLERECFVRRDFDGIIHCNYLSALRAVKEDTWIINYKEAAFKHKEFIIKGLSSTKYSVAQKYEWMKSYHNWFCKAYSDLEPFII